LPGWHWVMHPRGMDIVLAPWAENESTRRPLIPRPARRRHCHPQDVQLDSCAGMKADEFRGQGPVLGRSWNMVPNLNVPILAGEGRGLGSDALRCTASRQWSAKPLGNFSSEKPPSQGPLGGSAAPANDLGTETVFAKVTSQHLTTLRDVTTRDELSHTASVRK